MIYGYARVSSESQNLDRQIDALTREGIPIENIFMDKKSGKDFNRPSYKKMIETLKEGDMVLLLSLDRLGRSYNEIKDQWAYITRVIKADIRVLDMSLLDTSAYGTNDIMKNFMCDLILQILSFVAQTERDFIRMRQKEGIESAKSRGVVFGRKRLDLPSNFEYLYNLYLKGYSPEFLSSMTSEVSCSTLRRRLEERAESECAIRVSGI